MENNQKIAFFEEKTIRRLWFEEQWYFCISDVVAVLTSSKDPKAYWRQLKKKLIAEGAFQSVKNFHALKFEATDGKKYAQDATNTEGVFRLIMSIPSPKVEPFKIWLAHVGQERIEEIQNPELGIERIREIYRLKGYSEEWIDSRIKTIDIRKQLTDEWKKRGVKEGQEYSILTAEIAKATFGITPSEHKALKNLENQNLRDHMTNLELIFTMLGEEATRQIAIKDDTKGFEENHEAAIMGGQMAGGALKNFEGNKKLKVVSPENFLQQIESSNNKDLNIESPHEDL